MPTAFRVGMRAARGVRDNFIPAQREEYLDLAIYLRDQWGFY